MAIFLELPVFNSSFPQSDVFLRNVDTRVKSSSALPLPPQQAAQIPALPKPSWLKIRPPGSGAYSEVRKAVHSRRLHTVCEEAHCPNLSECWANSTATLMLGGDICTRACRFCAVKTARRPPALNPDEPDQVAESIVAMGLRYVVLTSVDRDDLEDGGASHFAKTIQAIRCLDPKIRVEALVPDFQGRADLVEIIVRSQLDVYAHNVETVSRLQKRVRDPRAGYQQSLQTLKYAKEFAQSLGYALYTKSSLMLGLGEDIEELKQTFSDLRQHHVDVLTLGQYLRPSPEHLPVERYVSPTEFQQLEQIARSYGFLFVASGVWVRSSYRAAELFMQGQIQS